MSLGALGLSSTPTTGLTLTMSCRLCDSDEVSRHREDFFGRCQAANAARPEYVTSTFFFSVLPTFCVCLMLVHIGRQTVVGINLLFSLLFHAGQAAIKLPSAVASKRAQCTSPVQYTPYMRGIMKTP